MTNGVFTTLARLNPDGSIDASFVRMVHGSPTPPYYGATSIVLQPDRKIVFGSSDITNAGDVLLGRLNPDGTIDSTFHAPICQGSVIALALQSDGKIVATGGLTFNGSCDTTQEDVVVRFNSDGTRDASFNDPFPLINSGSVNARVVIDGNGKILLTRFDQISRLNSDGTLDHSFNTGTGIARYVGGGGGSIYALALTSGGKILFGGGFDFYNGTLTESIVQVNSDGSMDASFRPNGPGTRAEVVALLQQPDGKWLVGLRPQNTGIGGVDETTKLNGVTGNAIGRLNADFSTDQTFTSPFKIGSLIVAIALQTDGKVIVSGNLILDPAQGSIQLARLNPDGTLDSTFIPPSSAGRGPLLIQPDGKIVVASLANGELLLRLNSNGQLDATLQDLGQSASISSMVLQGDGKILIGGLFSGVTVSPGHTVARNNIARLNQDGSADLSFDSGSGPSGGNSTPARTMVLQPDGKILIGGTFSDYNGTARPSIARLNSNGSLDTSFVPVNPNTGQFGAQGVGAISLQSDGKIIIGPDREDIPTSPMSIFRLNPDASLDQTFALRSGIANFGATNVNVITFQADRKILIGGAFDVVDGYPRMALARLLADTVAPTPTPTPLSTPTPTPTPSPTPVANTVQFSAANYNLNEGCMATIVTVTRSGDTSTPATVDFATSDGVAVQRSDYTIGSGMLIFSPGDTSKTFGVLATKDAYLEGNETFNISLTNVTGGPLLGTPALATVTILDDTTVPTRSQPIDDSSTFVCQHYHDFLARQADQAGQDYWTGQLTQCGADPICTRNRRLDVSNAFFYELEFQQTGAYIFRLYRAAFGNNQPLPNPDTMNTTEAKKIPNYAVFIADRARVVGGSDQAQAQRALANVFAQRTEFLTKYPANLDGPAFIDAVLATIKNDLGVDLGSQRAALLTLFNDAGGSSAGRGAVMYHVADDNLQTNPINNRALIDAEYNRSFVYTEYAGYLRRDSDIAGFLFWLGQVTNAPLGSVPKQHQMVCSFITSAEYQQRFSLVVTHSNAECPQ
jgi:uncharacterized delta-60 repeat protein